MKKILILLACITLTTFSFPSKSKVRDYSAKYEKCLENGISGSEIRTCMEDEQKLLDKRLNRAYANLSKIETPERKIQLLTAQKLWVQYQKANCNFYADPDGGSMALEDAGDCFLASTLNRAKELEYFLFLRKQNNP